MTAEKKHINAKDDLSKDALDMIARTSISWDENKEQIWARMEQKMETSKPAKTRVLSNPWLKVAVAAVFAILIGLPLFMRLYTKTISVPAGQHSSIYLPDNSQVNLNADSKISYKPLWYKFSRQIEFEGEAFFEVQPGKKFEVNSDQGKTVVLGTSFNVYSRNDGYNVTCVTGKVKVIEHANNSEVIIEPGQQAKLTTKGNLAIQKEINTGQTLLWIDNKFSFTSIPLSKVLDEIGRQYNVEISIPSGLDKKYTGTFNKVTSVETILQLVCKPFNLEYKQTSNNEYVITKSN